MLLVDQVRKLEQQVMDRLKELEPLTREYDQLRKVAQRLGLKYAPGSAKSDDGAKPSATRRRTAKRGGHAVSAQAGESKARKSPRQSACCQACGQAARRAINHCVEGGAVGEGERRERDGRAGASAQARLKWTTVPRPACGCAAGPTQ